MGLLDDRKFIEISPVLSKELAVFPGDTPFSRKVELDFQKGDNLLLSSLHTSSHIGAHVDAPNHYSPEGMDMASRDLNYYMGSAQVISVRKSRGDRIHAADIKGVTLLARRILFKTDSFPDPQEWNGDFNSLSKDLIEYLVSQNVILVGIDTPSIDPADDKVLEAHNAVFENNLAILEGIILNNVRDGVYTLLALPLRIEGGDASPVRAILIEN